MGIKRIVLSGLFLLVILSNGQGQKAQFGIRAISTDFDRTIGFKPLGPNQNFPSGVGLHVGFPYSNFLLLGIDARVAKMQNATDELLVAQNDELLYNLSGMARIQRVERGYLFKPFVQAGLGAQYMDGVEGIQPAVHLGVGLDIEIYKGLAIGVNSTFTRELSRNRYFMEYGLGLTLAINQYRTKQKELLETLTKTEDDLDGDGLLNDADECPELAGGLSTSGCPDKDADGVADRDDACPDQAGLIGNGGCPVFGSEVVTIDPPKIEAEATDKSKLAGLDNTDSDGDGIPDRLDLCPEQYGNEENNGCPELDSDNDGVSDEVDKCPKVFGSLYNQGCPDDYVISMGSKNDKTWNETIEKKVDEVDTVSKTDTSDREVEIGDFEPTTTFHPRIEKIEDKKIVEQAQPVDSAMTTSAKELKDTSNVELGDTDVQISKLDSMASGQDEKGVSILDQDDKTVDTTQTTVIAEEEGQEIKNVPPEEEVIVKVDENNDPKDPVSEFPDRDGDGIADRIDPCPDLAGTLENKGCPKVEDQSRDAARSQPTKEDIAQNENKGDDPVSTETTVAGESDLNSPELSDRGRFGFAPVINFQPGVAALQRRYVSELYQVAEFMLNNPEFDLKIYGHTDSKGSERMNDLLSKRRAKACYTFLTLAGKVPADRMTFHGVGEYSPISDNYTEAGRWKNRRVVFDFIRK